MGRTTCRFDVPSAETGKSALLSIAPWRGGGPPRQSLCKAKIGLTETIIPWKAAKQKAVHSLAHNRNAVLYCTIGRSEPGFGGLEEKERQNGL